MIVNTLKLGEPNFPGLLAQIPYPPQSIFWQGQPLESWLDRPKVAVVGSRKITPYGRTVTAKLVTELARAGVVIISGLAYGVDVAAHQTALAAGGTTVAVLPGGIDKIYPSGHTNIARQIIEQGSLITECPAGTESFKSNFIARNRIISGLADVLLITEAALKSGSLHTARFALEQGKTVMTVPGNITSPFSEGCNNLIKSGAIPVTSADDVFFALKINTTRNIPQTIVGTPDEQLVFSFIREGITAQEEIAVTSKLEGARLASILTMLELSGHIRPVGGGNWVAA